MAFVAFCLSEKTIFGGQWFSQRCFEMIPPWSTWVTQDSWLHLVVVLGLIVVLPLLLKSLSHFLESMAMLNFFFPVAVVQSGQYCAPVYVFFLLDHSWSSISHITGICSASAMRRCSSLVWSCFVLWGSKNIKQWPCNGWTRVNKPSTKNLANDGVILSHHTLPAVLKTCRSSSCLLRTSCSHSTASENLAGIIWQYMAWLTTNGSHQMLQATKAWQASLDLLLMFLETAFEHFILIGWAWQIELQKLGSANAEASETQRHIHWATGPAGPVKMKKRYTMPDIITDLC